MWTTYWSEREDSRGESQLACLESSADLSASSQHKWRHVTTPVKERGLYDILDIFPSATNADIRRAYLKQALQHHPDKNMHQPQVAHEMFKAVKQAYDILLDEKQRAIYNKHGLDYCLNGPPRDPPPELSLIHI